MVLFRALYDMGTHWKLSRRYPLAPRADAVVDLSMQEIQS